MADWTNFANGTWGDAIRWTGGVPDAVGAIANFTATDPDPTFAIVSFAQGLDVTIGTLNIVTDSNDRYLFRGQVDATLATLRFIGSGGSPAVLNVDTNGANPGTEISGEFGLRIVLGSDLIVTTANSDTVFTISAPITIAGAARDIIKYGNGTLRLTGATDLGGGDLLLRGGRTEVDGNSVDALGAIELDNGAVLVGVADGGISTPIETRTGDSRGTIAAATGTTMQLLGDVRLRSDAADAITFGSATDLGTIQINSNLIDSVVTGAGGMRIAGGTVQLFAGNDAVNDFFNNFSSTGSLRITGGGLDTRGVNANIRNLDLDGGTIRSSSGPLTLSITDTSSGADAQSGTIVGTAGADSITVSVTKDFSFFETTFNSWTNGTDLITLNGDNTANVITGSSQNDIINGGGGNDTLGGAGGVDTIRGGTGDDLYAIADTLSTLIENANEGTDTILIGVGGPATFTLADNFENLTFGNGVQHTGTGNAAANVISGGSGVDFLFGEGGNDRLDGNGGNDTLNGGLGGDILIGDGGIDTVDYRGNFGAIRVNLATNLGQFNFAEGDVYSEIENVEGTEFDDTLIGNAVVNRLRGNGGDDTLVGGMAGDALIGDAGVDTVDYTGNFGGVLVNLTTNTGQFNAAELDVYSEVENAIGTSFADTLIGNALDNRLDGGDGADTLDGRGGNDTLLGRGGNDVLKGGMGGDALDGGADVDTADYSGNFGGIWIDLVNGRGFSNAAEGDTLTAIENVIGTDYDDRFDSNGLANIFTGNAGNDTFFFQPGFGQDVVTDFQGNGAAAGDTIRFGTGTFANFAAVQAAMTQQGSNVVITLDAGNSVTLQNTTIAQLNAQDFLFG
jgi:Ca2+-binding RTX toxin-like protein